MLLSDASLQHWLLSHTINTIKDVPDSLRHVCIPTHVGSVKGKAFNSQMPVREVNKRKRRALKFTLASCCLLRSLWDTLVRTYRCFQKTPLISSVSYENSTKTVLQGCHSLKNGTDN